MIRILHVFSDDKFFDVVSDFFDGLDAVENLYYFLAPTSDYKFVYIHHHEKVKVFNSKRQYLKAFSDPAIDVVYFHSLPHKLYYLFNHIDDKKKVVWWSWGWDIYGTFHLLPPLLDVKRYGELTEKKAGNYWLSSYCLIRYPYWILRLFYDIWQRRKVIGRIDYFSPVLPVEYEMMKERVKGFRAEPFMMRGPGWRANGFRSPAGEGRNILIGNSLTKTNNHLEIFEHIRNYSLDVQKYIIPISYGGEYGKDEIKQLARLPEDSAVWLEGFIPKAEYDALFNNITHAIFGHLRQQGLGNIYTCLANGIKIFFFRDSTTYKSLKNDGYRVFTIEDDLTEDALRTVLPPDDVATNHRILSEQFGCNKENAEKELKQMFGCFAAL